MLSSIAGIPLSWVSVKSATGDANSLEVQAFVASSDPAATQAVLSAAVANGSLARQLQDTTGLQLVADSVALEQVSRAAWILWGADEEAAPPHDSSALQQTKQNTAMKCCSPHLVQVPDLTAPPTEAPSPAPSPAPPASSSGSGSSSAGPIIGAVVGVIAAVGRLTMPRSRFVLRSAI